MIGLGLVPLACLDAIAVGGGFSKYVLGISDAFFIMGVAGFAYFWALLFSGLGVFLAFRLSRQSHQRPSIICNSYDLI